MKVIWGFLAILALAYPGECRADDELTDASLEEVIAECPPLVACVDPCAANNSFLVIGANYTRANIKPSGESSFNGNLGGLQGLYEYQPANAFYAGVEFYWRQGSASGADGKRNLIDLKAAERLGYTWVCNEWLCTFFSGFGFRSLLHHFEPSEILPNTFIGSFFPPFLTDETSLDLDYYEFYFPVGIVSEYTFSGWLTMGLYFTWMPQAFSTVHISPLGGTFWSLTNTFGNFLVEMPFIFNLTCDRSFALTVNPFYERWHDGHSTAKTSRGTSLGLAGNAYNFYGANVNLIYSF